MLGPVANDYGVEGDLPLQEPNNVHLIYSTKSMEESKHHNNPRMTKKYRTIVSNSESESDQSGSDLDSVSESTNPYLERLLDLYFPSDEEDVGCEADGEYDAIDDGGACTANGTGNTAASSRRQKTTKRRSSPVPQNQSPVRKKSPLRSRRNNFHNKNRSVKSADQACSITLEENEGGIGQNTVHELDTAEWLQEARRQYVVGEVERQKAKLRMNNEWDSSPSSIDVESKDGLDREELNGEYMGVFREGHYGNDVRKSLFSHMAKDRIVGVTTYKEKIDEEDETETEREDDDLELTYRARRIQHDLRLQEMKEIAVEAERAAEEGKEKFIGNATRFGVDDTLSLESQRSSPRKGIINDVDSWARCGSLESDEPESLIKRKPKSPIFISGMSYKYSYSSYKVTPTTDIKRPRSVASRDRQKSAPSKLQNRNHSPPLADVPTMTSILTAKSFLSLTQSKFAEKKVPVLSLRHMEEVIPSFGEMHHYLRSHIIRAGVKEDTLKSQVDEAMDKVGKETYDEKESGAGSRASSGSMFRIQSFQKLFNSFSNLSAEESAKSKTTGVDSDLEIGPASEAEKYLEKCSIVANTDCASLVSCGDSSIDEDIIQKQIQQVVEESFSDDGHVEEGDKHLTINTSESSDIYVQTLASEIHSPGRRPRSPPGPPPYSDIDDNLKAFLKARTAPQNGSPPKSRWTTFWANMSPTRSFVIPAPRRTQSMVMDSKPALGGLMRPRLVTYHSFRQQPPPILSPQWLDANSDAYPQPDFIPLSEDKKEFVKQNCATFQKTESNNGCGNEVGNGVVKRQSTCRDSEKTLVTQRSSYESDSAESAFSRYSKYSKINDSIHEKDSDPLGSSIRSIKENEDELFDAWPDPIHKRQSSITRDIDSATSPKPPLHPAGIRLATALLNNAGIRNGAEGKDHASKKSEPLLTGRSSPSNTVCEISSSKSSEASKKLTKQNKVDLIHFQHTIQDVSAPYSTARDQPKKTNREIDGIKPERITSSQHIMKRENSISSIHSYCVGEECSNCGEDAPAQVEFREIMESTGQPEDEGTEANDEDKNNSMSSFMELMENVKVPSMMQTLSPLLGRKEMKDKSEYEDDTAFIGNYFYIGVGAENDEVIQHNEPRFSQYHHKRNRFCQRSQCADAGCEDFGSFMVQRTFKFLSKKSSWDKESGPLLNEPQNYDGHPWLRKALSQCAGHQLHRRRQEVIFGEKRFRAPNLRIQKGGFFAREGAEEEEEDEIHDTFKVGHTSITPDKSEELENFIFPGIEIGPIKEDLDQIGISISEVGDLTEEYKAARYRESMKRASFRSLLTFSDDEHSSLDNI